MDHEFEFDYPNEGNPRKAYRVQVAGLKASFQGENVFWQVKDLSAMGLGVYADPQKLVLNSGQEVSISLFRYGELLLQELPAKVIRQNQEVAAFEFQKMGRRQEYELDKLVLEIQKEMIERKKKQGSE
ncbi:MAG: PilZ domain-containing protein [Desulfohalobiaceae bacterium]